MSLARLDLSLARLGRGDVEGAAYQVQDVLQVHARRGTESVRKRLGHLQRTLSAHPAATSPTGIGLREALADHHQHDSLSLPHGGTR